MFKDNQTSLPEKFDFLGLDSITEFLDHPYLDNPNFPQKSYQDYLDLFFYYVL